MASAETEDKVIVVNAEGEENSGQQSEQRTFIRVKRRIKDDPPAALRLSYKRQRVEIEEKKEGERSEDSGTISDVHVLRFAGSFQPDQTLGSFLKGFDSSALKPDDEKVSEVVNLKAAPVSDRGRRKRMLEETKKKSSSCRYKIISARRGLEDVSNLEAEAKGAEDENYLYSMFDLVEDELHAKPTTKESREVPAGEVITCNNVPMVVTKTPEKKSEGPECDYVYDVYTIGKPLSVEDQHVDVEHLYGDELVFEQEESEEEKYDEETDSNDENNPNNSYPDENSDSSMASCEEKYYGFEEPDLYNWSDDEEVYGDADEEGGSRAMKELAKHLQETGLSGRSGSESST